MVGEPPEHSRSLQAQQGEPPVGWTMWWNDHELGRALTTTEAGRDDVTDVHNRLYFEHVPLREIIPPLVQNILSPAEAISPMQSTNVVTAPTSKYDGGIADIASAPIRSA